MKSTTCINDHTNDARLYTTLAGKCKNALKIDPIHYSLTNGFKTL